MIGSFSKSDYSDSRTDVQRPDTGRCWHFLSATGPHCHERTGDGRIGHLDQRLPGSSLSYVKWSNCCFYKKEKTESTLGPAPCPSFRGAVVLPAVKMSLLLLLLLPHPPSPLAAPIIWSPLVSSVHGPGINLTRVSSSSFIYLRPRLGGSSRGQRQIHLGHHIRTA